MRRLIVLPLAATLLAQDAQNPVIRTYVQNVVIPVTVQRDGHFITDLEAKDFRVLDNDKPQDIKADVSFIPISLVVAIQANSATEQVLPTLKRLGSLLEGLVTGEQGEVALISFDHRIQLLQDFTNDSKLLNAALEKLKPGSNTSRLNDAVIESTRLLKRRPADRRKILMLISETKDGGSEGKPRDALLALEFNNVIVYPVNMSRWINKILKKPDVPQPDPFPVAGRPLPPGAPRTPNTLAQLGGTQGTMGNFAPLFTEVFTGLKAIFVSNPQELFTRYTGGSEHSFVGLKGFEEAVGAIGEELHSQYLLSYNPSNKLEGGFHRVQVIVNRPGLKVKARAGYWMAGMPE
ncbi:MAG: VWA domain-containing protein [Acidobacteria bacterium]|nr:VWA domain-containing protein [Acidobacteriota bacterium]